jgi:hypothetical protein
LLAYIVSSVARDEMCGWRPQVLLVCFSYFLVSAKVSTALILLPALILGGSCFNRRSLNFAKSFVILPGLTLGGLLAFVFSLGVLSKSGNDFSRISLAIGGYLAENSEWMDSSRLKMLIVIGVLTFGLYFPIPVLLFMTLKESNLRHLVLIASMAAAISIPLRFFVVTHQSHYYTDVSLQLMAITVISVLFGHRESWSLRLSSRLFGIALGVVCGLVSFYGSFELGNSSVSRVVRLASNGGIVLGLAVSMFSLLQLLDRGTRKSLLLCLYLVAGSMFGVGIARNVEASTWKFDRAIFTRREDMFRGTTAEKSAAMWLRENTRFDDVIATNRLCEVGEACPLDGQSPVAALALRRTWIEAERFVAGNAVTAVAYGESSPRGHPAWLNERKQLSLDFVGSPSDEVVQQIIDSKVRYFWIDPTRTKRRNWEPYATIRFENAEVIIVEMRGTVDYTIE